MASQVPGIPGQVPVQAKDPRDPAAISRERIIVLSLEFSRRALEARSLEELYFLLTNDIRALVEFDRSFLITHIRGESRYVAAGNQPITEKKSKFSQELDNLGLRIQGLNKTVLLASPADLEKLSDDVLAPEFKDAFRSYMHFAECTGILCVPLIFDGQTLGHLLLEYLDGKAPDQVNVLALAKLAPVFAAALAQRWVFAQNPELSRLTEVSSWRQKPVMKFLAGHWLVLAIGAPLLIALLFMIPFSYPVGGEADIVPRDRHVAFCMTDGLIDKILVAEGSQVKQGQVLATIDPTELDFKIKTSERQLELLTAEMTLLKRSSGQDISKLAESRLVELKAKNVQTELQFFQWQKQFLQIKAPASGVVTTKHVETLIGKKFKAGEPFCEIAAPGELWAEIYVLEDKVSRIKKGQDGVLNLNNEPRTGYEIDVKEIAPRAEAIPRLGNVYRVRASFRGDPPPRLKVGMKGVGTIYAEKTSVYSFITHRLVARWNQLALYLL
ncbi:MAG: HlyD family efflux transporter periplasmic adaptor subunit [Desulfomonile tiedjei]|nr:HlyD family efflux transporter periplasmic adaptor subunit [Desulfomonile tiedjei]